MRSKTTVIVNTNDEVKGWPKLREALTSIGCDQETSRRIWERIKSQHIGQINPFTGLKPSVSLQSLERALNGEIPKALADGEVAIVWEHGNLTPENARIDIYK